MLLPTYRILEKGDLKIKFCAYAENRIQAACVLILQIFQ